MKIIQSEYFGQVQLMDKHDNDFKTLKSLISKYPVNTLCFLNEEFLEDKNLEIIIVPKGERIE